MKKRIIGILPVLVFTLGCNQALTQEPNKNSQNTNQDDENNISSLMQASMKGVETIKYHDYMDPKLGIVQTRYPIPKSWTVNTPGSDVYIEGPDKLKVFKTETSQYGWSNDPMMQQTIQMSGYQLAQPMENREVIRQFLEPGAEQQGYKLLKVYDLPEIAGFWQRYFHAMPNTGTRRSVEATGSEWQSDNGLKSFIVLVRSQYMNQEMLLWNFQTTELEASPEYFDEAKNAYLYAFANAKMNPEWISQMNGRLIGSMERNRAFWKQASQQSAAAHQQRMNAIASRGNTARSIGETYSDILDISHKGYLNRSSINDAGHSKSIRSINETTLIGNHETGEHYDVPAGSNYYWVSDDGVYIGTDNPLFNPNVESGVNDKEWTKFAVEQ